VGSALSPARKFEFVGARYAVPAIAAKLQIAARQRPKFFSHIMHVRNDCEEMIRWWRAIQKLPSVGAREETGCFA
jgi:hypothetical protein